MKKRIGFGRASKYAIILTAVLGMLLAGCGSADSSMRATESTSEASYAMDYATDDIYSNAEMAEYTEEAYDTYDSGDTESSVAITDTSRKLIRTVSMNVETKEFDTLTAKITAKTAEYGGYVESSNVYQGSAYDTAYQSTRDASFTLRIPEKQLDAFLATVSELSNVTSRTESVEDVTLQYVDLDSHKKALETEQERLLELLEQAESVEDIITIESELSSVRYQIESMESQLRSLQNQVSYSTVYLYVSEVKELTQVEEISTWERIQNGFMGSLYDLEYTAEELGIWILIHAPYWIVIIVILVILLLIRKGIRKKKRKKKEKREQEKTDSSANTNAGANTDRKPEE